MLERLKAYAADTKPLLEQVIAFRQQTLGGWNVTNGSVRVFFKKGDVSVIYSEHGVGWRLESVRMVDDGHVLWRMNGDTLKVTSTRSSRVVPLGDGFVRSWRDCDEVFYE